MVPALVSAGCGRFGGRVLVLALVPEAGCARIFKMGRAYKMFLAIWGGLVFLNYAGIMAELFPTPFPWAR